VPGTTDTGNHCVWCSTLITLPFPFVLYNQAFNAVNVTSSGRLAFVCDNEPDGYTERCLPASPYNCAYDFTIFALWYEWGTLTYPEGCSTWANGCGIFTSISGTAPNRVFNIEWHVIDRKESTQTGNFEVRLYENDPNQRFDVIYGQSQKLLYTPAVAGVQGPPEFFTQDLCSVPAPQNTLRTYQLESCTTPTPTATPRATPRPRPSPHPRPTPLPHPVRDPLQQGTLKRTAGSTTTHSPPTPTPQPRVTPHPRPTPPPLPSPTPPIVVDVEVGPGFAFVPSNVYIPVGGIVRWTWASNGHSVTSGVLCTADEQFCSPNDMNCDAGTLSNTGTVYEHTFTEPGTYPYFCFAHCASGMTGTVTVVPEPPPGPRPTPFPRP
jgi:plastocyanin